MWASLRLVKKEPVIDYPPVSTRKWIPPDRRKKKPKKKLPMCPVPVSTRKWVPPDQRKKRRRKKPPPYPPQLHSPLQRSSLRKVWHVYNVIHGCAVLLGNRSQFHKKYSYISNGFQGAANCVMAILFSRLSNCTYWNPYMLDNVLNHGDHFYLACKKMHKCKNYLRLTDLLRELYIFNYKIFINFKGRKFKGLLYKDLGVDQDNLENVVKDFFGEHESGVIAMGGTSERHFAIWKIGKGYWLFDPTDHDNMCWPSKDVPGKGKCFLVRFPDIARLVEVIHRNMGPTNLELEISPVGIQRVVSINTNYPGCLMDANLEKLDEKVSKVIEDDTYLMNKHPKEIPDMPVMEAVPKFDNDSETSIQVKEVKGDDKAASKHDLRTEVRMRKVLVEKPRVDSVTYFNDIIPDRIGILLAETHQEDPDFASCPGKDFKGKPSLGNAVAALVMLRQSKAKYWTTKILTNVLRLGYRVCKETRRALGSDQVPALKNVIRRIELNQRAYTPVITDLGAVGRLQSDDFAALDLYPAVKELLSECDTVIVQGPLVVALWKEEGLYYMFDPNERDPNGLAIVKEVRVGSVMEAVEYTSGVACLTWFRDLKDLVEMYMLNVEKDKRRDQFVVSNVEIKDYVQLPENWRNFRAIVDDRWILSGNFCQSDKRFHRISRNTQCTANCAMAIAYVHILPITEWTSETLDKILIRGNDYYMESASQLRKKQKFVNTSLMVVELNREFVVENQMVIMEIAECLVNGFITIHDGYKNTLNLKKGLTEFLQENHFGILTCRGISVAVMRIGGGFYYFDSHNRDDEGFVKAFGKSCVIRFTSAERMAEMIMANLGPAEMQAIYNISGIEISTFKPLPPDAPLDEDDDDELYAGEIDGEGQGVTETNVLESFRVDLPEYDYRKLTKRRAILRSKFHQGDKFFGTNAGKQTLPNLLTAIAMARMFDPRMWSLDRLNDVLLRGNELYNTCMDLLYKGQTSESILELEIVDDDDITLYNIITKFNIGINKFVVNFKNLAEGEIGPDGSKLRQYMADHLKGDCTDTDDFKELILQIGDLEVVVWKMNGLYYAFDPKARDERGDIYGREEGSDVSTEVEEASTVGDEEAFMRDYDEMEGEQDELPDVDIKRFLDQKWNQYDEQGEEDEGEEAYAKPRHPQEYFDDLQAKLGRANIMWFAKARHLIKHVIENTRPKMRRETTYTLTKVRMVNTAVVKTTYNPEAGAKRDEMTGDWNEFKEITYGQWILRGSVHQKDELFPENNRGKQSDANCLIALAYAALYGLSKYSKHTVDQILKYGDRLYTATKRYRRKLLEDLEVALSPADIDEVLKLDHYTVEHLLKSFCIGDDSMSAQVHEDFIAGEVHAQDLRSEMDVQRALEKFFGDHSNVYCILSAKGESVAVWRVRTFFYMFDPCQRGPHGYGFENGVACVMRFTSLSCITDLFLKNIPRIGKNFFALHKVIPAPGICHKPLKEETRKTDGQLKLTGFTQFARGKHIVQGTVHQDHVIFGRGTNAQCAPISMVALAMTLVHNTEYWTKLVIDEVIAIGDRIYGNLLEKCDLNFNPWEEKLTVPMAPNDFKIGKNKVNCELRFTEQRGVIETKNPSVLNLRQGIERFFEENCYGILQTDLLTVPIWEAEDEGNSNYLYMLDPNCRGPTGQPVHEDGTACLLKFCGAKLLCDHVISLVATDRDGEFLITPVEIVIERDGKCKKTKRYGMTRNLESAGKSSHSKKLGRLTFYDIPNTDFAILRGSKSQQSKVYSENSRGNQDVPNCIVSYVMDKLIPLARWNYKTIDMLLDIGDQLYKDSYMIYDPRDKKLRMETLVRDVVIRDVRVKISVGAPIIAAQFNVRLLTEALYNSFNLKPFCIVLADQSAVAIFKKEEEYYLFDPMDVDLMGNRSEKGSAALLRFQGITPLILQMVKNLQADGAKETFHVIIVGIKGIERVPVGTNFDEKPQNLLKPDCIKCPCDRSLFGHIKRHTK